MSIRRTQTPLAAAVLATLLCAAPCRAEMVDGIAIVVDDDIILMSEVVERAAMIAQQWEALYQETIGIEQAMSIAAGELVDGLLFKQLAQQMHVSISKKEIDTALANQLASQGASLDEFEEALEAQGLDLHTYKQEVIKRQLLRYKVMGLKVGGPKVTEAMVKDFYTEQVAALRAKAAFEISVIFVATPQDANIVELAEYRKKAETIATEARQEDADFAQLAAQYSDDAQSADRGGYLGEFDPGDLPDTVDSAVLKLDVGEISDPVRTSTGFFVIKLVDRHAAKVKSFEDAHDGIMNELIEQEMVRQEKILLKELRRNTYIEVKQ